MNLTNLAAAIREDMTTIKVKFYNTSTKELTEKDYTYKCKRDLAQQLEEGDLVAVNAESASNYKHTAIAIVQSVDEEPDIDLDSNQRTLKWAICKIDEAEAKHRQLEDEKVGKKLRLQKSQNCRKQALSLLGLTQEEARKLLT